MRTTMLAARACDGKRQTFKSAREAVLCGSAYKRCQRRRLSAMPATTSAALPYGRACDALCSVCSNVFTDYTHTAVIIEDVQATSSPITNGAVIALPHGIAHALPYGNAADIVTGIAERRRR